MNSGQAFGRMGIGRFPTSSICEIQNIASDELTLTGGNDKLLANAIRSSPFRFSLAKDLAPDVTRKMISRYKKLNRSVLHYIWFEHGIPLLLFTILSLAISWPTVQHFTSSLTSSGGDARHNLWILWHVKEAVLGQEPWFHTSLLYYPHGASLLTHGVGPVEGLFALPFWLWGPEAANNGALLVGLCLTGYLMYLFARSLGFDRSIALFAGILLMTSEMVLAGLLGHIEKTFIGFLPLVLLSLHRTLNPRRSSTWAVPTALVLVLTLLHHGLQFVLATLAIVFFVIVKLLNPEQYKYRELLTRVGLLVISMVTIVGPILFMIVDAAGNPAISVAKNFESLNNQPDLIEFFVPSRFSWLFGGLSTQYLLSHEIRWSIETTVSLTWTGILLCMLAWVYRVKSARLWLLFGGLFMLVSLGPTLKVFAKADFTEYDLPIILPYAFLTALPGLDFLRTPGQFMLMGFVGLSVAASFGLRSLADRVPQRRNLVIYLAVALVLIESWPRPWPEEKLRPIPDFYPRIADENEIYGVFDLPIRPSPDGWEVGYSSYYQIYQMTHNKGIASGYLSRTYDKHPALPCLFSHTPVEPDVFVNGRPSNCLANAQYELARHDYRYVVWHKPKEWYPVYKPGSWGEINVKWIIQQVFDQPQPIVDDELTRVYLVDPSTDPSNLTTTLELEHNWHVREDGWRWAASPATLKIASPGQQSALLEIMPFSMHDPQSLNGAGREGLLTVQMDDGFMRTVEMVKDQPISLPLELVPGTQTITLSLKSGNFQPTQYGESDPRILSFAVRYLNLQVIDDTAPTSDVMTDS